jgi:hypothetical protein
MLMTVLCVPFVIIFGFFFLMAVVEIFGPFVLAMLLLLKWTLSTIIEFIRYLFRPKETASPA